MARLVTLSASFVVTMTLVATALATVVSRGTHAQGPAPPSSDARALDTRPWNGDSGVRTGGGPQIRHRLSADLGCVFVGR